MKHYPPGSRLGALYDNYSTGVVEWALQETPGVWARLEGKGCAGGEAGVDAGLQKILAAAARSGAAGLVLHEPGHFVAIRSADLALLAELAEREGREPAVGDRHRFHIIDSMRREETTGLTATQVIELVRDRLRNGHDVIVVGREGGTDVATGGAPKRARSNGAGGDGGGGVRAGGGAGDGSDAGTTSTATASTDAAEDAATVGMDATDEAAAAGFDDGGAELAELAAGLGPGSIAAVDVAGAAGSADVPDLMAVDEAPAADAGEMGDDGPAASAEPSAGPTAAEYQARYGVFWAAFNVPLGPFDASRWTRAPAVGEDAGADGDVGGDADEDEDEVVGTGAAAAPTLEWAAGCAAWYVGRARATLPAPSEAARPQGGEGGHGMDDAAGGDAAARRGDGTAGGGGAERMGAVGMEVEGPTDGAAEVGQGAAGMAAADSTDTTGGGDGPTKARKKTKRGKKGGRSQYERQRGARKR